MSGIRAEGEASAGPGAAHRAPCVSRPSPVGAQRPATATLRDWLLLPRGPRGLQRAPRQTWVHMVGRGGPESRPHLCTPGRSSLCPGTLGGCYRVSGLPTGSRPGSPTAPALPNPRKPLRLRQPGRWAGSWMPDGPAGTPAPAVPLPPHMATWELTPRATEQTKPRPPLVSGPALQVTDTVLGSLVSLPRRGRPGWPPGLLHLSRTCRMAPVPRASLVN